MWECFSARGKELNRLVKEKNYGELLRQARYDVVSEFAHVIHILKRNRDNYADLTNAIDADLTGIVVAMIKPRLGLSEKQIEQLSDEAKQRFFAEGVEDRARDRSDLELTNELNAKGFTNKKVKDEIAKQRSLEMRSRGLEIVAKEIPDYIRVNHIRENYVERHKKRLDERIEETQEEAINAVKDQIASTQDYMKLLGDKRAELMEPLVRRKDNLDEQYVVDLKTALDHLKQGQIRKAYLLLSALDHQGTQYIQMGINCVREKLTPRSLLEVLLKNIGVNECSLARTDVSLYRCNKDFYALVTANRQTFIKYFNAMESDAPKFICDSVLNSVSTGNWDNEHLRPSGFLPMEQKIKTIVQQASYHDHRE